MRWYGSGSESRYGEWRLTLLAFHAALELSCLRGTNADESEWRSPPQRPSAAAGDDAGPFMGYAAAVPRAAASCEAARFRR